MHARGSHAGFCSTGKRNVCHMESENIGRKISLIYKPEKECCKQIKKKLKILKSREGGQKHVYPSPVGWDKDEQIPLGGRQCSSPTPVTSTETWLTLQMCTCSYIHKHWKSPSYHMHSTNIQPSTFLLISTLNQLRTRKKDKKAYLFPASVIGEWQNLTRHFVSSTTFHACCHLPPEPNGNLPWMVCSLLFFQFPCLLFISLASQEPFRGPITSCWPGKAMRTNSYIGLKYTHYHKKNRGKGARDLLSKGWWKSWDRELPEILKKGFMSRLDLDTISARNRASEFLLRQCCNLNLHILNQFNVSFGF